jgi:hypothetical protein
MPDGRAESRAKCSSFSGIFVISRYANRLVPRAAELDHFAPML